MKSILTNFVLALMLGASFIVPASAQSLSEQDAYVYAYPLVLSDLTRRQATNHEVPGGESAQSRCH